MSLYVDVHSVPSGRVCASLFLLTAIIYLPLTTSDSDSDYELFLSFVVAVVVVVALFQMV